MARVDFISPELFSPGVEEEEEEEVGMFYNQVKWLEIRAILSNLVLRPPRQAQSRFPSFLPSSFSVYLLSKLIRLISSLDTCV